MKINSVCLSRTRFVIRSNFRQYILFAGLQLSIPRAIDISSIVCRRSFSVYRLSSIICLSVNLYSSLPVDGCCLLAPHLSGAAVGRRNFAAAVCDACRHPSPCSDCWHGAARDDLASSVTHLCHHRRGVQLLSRFHFVDQCPVVAVLLVRPVLLAE